MESNSRIKEVNQMIKFILGFILGGMAGVGTMCLVAINRGEEDE